MIKADDSDFVWVHFTGDVAVSPTVGTMGKYKLAIVSLQNLTSKLEPGTDITKENGHLLSGPRVRLSFINGQSIDVVIKALQLAKEKFIEFEKSEEKPK